MAKLLRGSCYTLVALAVVGGCQTGGIAPFGAHTMQEQERAAAQGAPVRPARPLPTTLQSPFLEEDAGGTTVPATKRTAPPAATGPAIGTIETTVRMPLREIVH